MSTFTKIYKNTYKCTIVSIKYIALSLTHPWYPLMPKSINHNTHKSNNTVAIGSTQYTSGYCTSISMTQQI